MNRKIRFITQTALLLALLIVLQAATKAFGQLVTGSCVNAVLAIAVLLVGLGSGIVIALVSPVLAFLLGIAPQAVTVPAIMIGNAVYVLVLWTVVKVSLMRRIGGLVLASAAKFAVLYFLVSRLICGLLSAPLLEGGLLNKSMLILLPTIFSWPQLFTALIGGGMALLLVPVLKRALPGYDSPSGKPTA